MKTVIFAAGVTLLLLTAMPANGQLYQRQIFAVSYRSNSGPWSEWKETQLTVSLYREKFRMRIIDESGKSVTYLTDGTERERFTINERIYFLHRCTDNERAASIVVIIVAPDDNVEIEVHRKGYAVKYQLVNGPPLYSMGF